MLALGLIPGVFILVTTALFFRAGWSRVAGCWRSAFLAALIVVATITVASTELLSLLRLLTFGWILAVWLMATVASGWLLYCTRGAALERTSPPLSRRIDFPWFCIGSVIFIAAILLSIALAAPPNTFDSMTYHMSRVEHWIQNSSISHYPTHITRQLYLSPLAEYHILHLQILSGCDRFANLVQWFSMVGCCVGVSLIAGMLGAGRAAQAVASAFCATLPMGILQATGTFNDYVNSFMMANLVLIVLRFTERSTLGQAAVTGLTAGLAILTKATSYLYAFPFLLWFAWTVIKLVRRTKRVALFAIVSIALLVAPNAGHLVRNTRVFGTPFGVGQEHGTGYTNKAFGIRPLLSNIIRNCSIHAEQPFYAVRYVETRVVEILHEWLGIDPSDPRTTFGNEKFGIKVTSTHEDNAGNTLHFLVVLGCVILLCSRYGRLKDSLVFTYGLCLLIGFLLFCFCLKWQPWHSRLHLPLFVLAAPLVAVVLGKDSAGRFVKITACMLILLSSVWVFRNWSRPVLARKNVFNTPRLEQRFVNMPHLMKPYSLAVRQLVEGGYETVGLVIGSDDWEYPLYPMLKAAGKRPEIHHTQVRNASERLEDKGRRFDALLVIDNGKNTAEVVKQASEE